MRTHAIVQNSCAPRVAQRSIDAPRIKHALFKTAVTQSHIRRDRQAGLRLQTFANGSEIRLAVRCANAVTAGAENQGRTSLCFSNGAVVTDNAQFAHARIVFKTKTQIGIDLTRYNGAIFGARYLIGNKTLR